MRKAEPLREKEIHANIAFDTYKRYVQAINHTEMLNNFRKIEYFMN